MLKRQLNNYKLELRDGPNSLEQRKNLSKEILRDSTFFPKTVEYKDIDEAFTKWVENELRIVFEDEVVPTYALFSNQRFTEYMQMWENVDDNRNVKMNFKVVTRDNNPKERSMYAKAGNIPINKKYLMKRVETINDQGKKCYLDYKMSQPVTVDLVYRITLVTNKYELLNEMNSQIHSKFCSIQSYLFVNDHAMPMKLNNISDDSDYTADDRQYFSQTYEITLSGYIITEDDFEIVMNPIVTLACIGVEGNREKKKAVVEIEEMDIVENECPKEEEPEFLNQRIKLSITFEPCDDLEREFIIDTEMVVEKLEHTNIRTYKLKVNEKNVLIDTIDGFHENDLIYIKIKPVNKLKPCTIVMEGYNPDEFYEVNDKEDISQEIIIQ